jgi:hypothetical protein
MTITLFKISISGNCWVSSLYSNTAFVGTSFDKHVTSLTPAGSPLVTDDPVRNVVEYTVTDDDHSVIEVVDISEAGRVTEDSTPSFKYIHINLN